MKSYIKLFNSEENIFKKAKTIEIVSFKLNSLEFEQSIKNTSFT